MRTLYSVKADGAKTAAFYLVGNDIGNVDYDRLKDAQRAIEWAAKMPTTLKSPSLPLTITFLGHVFELGESLP